jgi:hypothetical protein
MKPHTLAAELAALPISTCTWASTTTADRAQRIAPSRPGFPAKLRAVALAPALARPTLVRTRTGPTPAASRPRTVRRAVHLRHVSHAFTVSDSLTRTSQEHIGNQDQAY